MATQEKNLIRKMKALNAPAELISTTEGPALTRYNIRPALDVTARKLQSIAPDIAAAIGASSVMIKQTPGEAGVWSIDVPREDRQTVRFADCVTKNYDGLTIEIGQNEVGEIIECDLTKMPHLLIAGTTGAGKSTTMNSIISSLILKYDPSKVTLLMIDPKRVELSAYSNVRNLRAPIATNANDAMDLLDDAIDLMEARYKNFEDKGVKDLKAYNEKYPALDRVVIIIDELAELMMMAGKAIEDQIVRIAQLGRAAGIHLIIATQRPQVKVVTGLIKANIPSRIAFKVASQIDSRVILDRTGAEKLLGNGDMIYQPVGGEPQRVQGCYITDDEIATIVAARQRK